MACASTSSGSGPPSTRRSTYPQESRGSTIDVLVGCRTRQFSASTPSRSGPFSWSPLRARHVAGEVRPPAARAV
ncbi:hypothetical protein [Nocardiopsis sp. FIRDI 009]|uniref:hypothetical protein n=1 Tax=Nocardiopsis sp. FIRDI 009 TaxID=714197 RepID=UPI001300AC81|nr:hypothetical protein [Nocardiopsis sp. FIRDI 009]